MPILTPDEPITRWNIWIHSNVVPDGEIKGLPWGSRPLSVGECFIEIENIWKQYFSLMLDLRLDDEPLLPGYGDHLHVECVPPDEDWSKIRHLASFGFCTQFDRNQAQKSTSLRKAFHPFFIIDDHGVFDDQFIYDFNELASCCCEFAEKRGEVNWNGDVL